MNKAQHLRTTIPVALVVAFGGLGFTGCVTERVVLDEQHCANNIGDATCTERYGSERPYCVDGYCGPTLGEDGCVAELPADPECYLPCGDSPQSDPACMPGESSSGGSSGGSTTAGEESSSSGEESTTTGPMPCVGHEECTDDAAPLCDPAVGECVSCDAWTQGSSDEACAELDTMVPLCIGSGCVACDPKGDTSVCDGQLLLCTADNACGPCVEHAECDSGACDIAVGSCFDPLNVLDVGMGQTYGSIAAALGDVETMKLDNAVLRLHGGADFNETATVASGAVAFVAAEGQNPQWINSAVVAPTLTVSGAETRVYVAGVRLAQNGNDVGLVVDGATVDVRRSRIVQNSGGGIVAQGGATLTVENCFVGSLGDVVGIEVNGSTAEILYTTVTASTFGTTPAVGCTSPLAVEIRNSIVVTQGGTSPDELVCGGGTVTNTATEADTPGFDSGWFIDYNAGNLGLTKTGAAVFMEIAEWQDGDPLTDIDGNPRPTTNGSPDYAGADVP